MNLNWEILTENLVIFERWDGLRMKNFNMGIHWRIRFLRGVTKNEYVRGNPLKGGLGQFGDLGEGLMKKRWVLFLRGGVNTPMHTMPTRFLWKQIFLLKINHFNERVTTECHSHNNHWVILPLSFFVNSWSNVKHWWIFHSLIKTRLLFSQLLNQSLFGLIDLWSWEGISHSHYILISKVKAFWEKRFLYILSFL